MASPYMARSTPASAGSAMACRKTGTITKANCWSTATAIMRSSASRRTIVADGIRHQGRGRIPARLGRRVQRLDRRQSAVRPARQHGRHMTSNNGLPRSAYSFNGDGARAGQAFNDQLYVGCPHAIRHTDLRSPTKPRHRHDACLRSGRRRLFLFVHRLQWHHGRRRRHPGHTLGRRREISRRIWPRSFRRHV